MNIKNSLLSKALLKVIAVVTIAFGLILFYILKIDASQSSSNQNKIHQELAILLSEKVALNIEMNFENLNAFESVITGVIDNNNENADALLKQILLNQANTSKHFVSFWAVIKNADAWDLYEAKKGSSSTLKDNGSQVNSRFATLLTKNGVYFSNPYSMQGNLVVDVACPLSGSKKGFVGGTISKKQFQTYLISSTQVNGSLINLVGKSGVLFSSSDKFDDAKIDSEIADNLTKGITFSKKVKRAGTSYQSYFVPIKFQLNLPPMLVEYAVPSSFFYANNIKSHMVLILIIIAGMVVLIIIVGLIINSIVSPIKKMSNVLNLLSQGNTQSIQKVEEKTEGELQEMGEHLNKVVDGMKATGLYALEIGKGNLNEEYKLLSDADDLGKALISMQNSLVESNKAELQRKEEEEIRNWMNQGIAKFNEILRKNNDSLDKLGSNTLSNLISYLNVNQGAIFVLNNDEENKQKSFDLVTAVAYGREKFINKNIGMGEGLVGRCGFEKKRIYITDVPNDYAEITSGLGTANPSAILIVPCILNDEVYSIIELASFEPFKPHEIEFVETLAESIASTIASVQINEQTAALLNRSKDQREELVAQEEELRQNLEEMESTQEDLQRQMAQNAALRDEMMKNNALLDALLSLLPDFIYFKDSESRFLRVSKSMLSLFAAKDENEIIGKSDFDYHTPENAQKYYDDEKAIQQSKQGFVNLLQKEIKVDGSTMWNSVTKMPLIDADGNVFGTFGISKDVTEIKELELKAQLQEAESSKQKALLDALLRTLPDFIYFKDLDSKFIRLSHSMLNLFDAQSEEEVIGKSDFDFQREDLAKEYYNEEQEIIKSKKGITNKIIKEKFVDGSDQWMSITKLPLLDVEGVAMGTFGISKNVTEIKELELEAKKMNEELKKKGKK